MWNFKTSTSLCGQKVLDSEAFWIRDAQFAKTKPLCRPVGAPQMFPLDPFHLSQRNGKHHHGLIRESQFNNQALTTLSDGAWGQGVWLLLELSLYVM